MEYKDDQLLNDYQSKNYNNSLNKISIQEQQDLSELYDKLSNQKKMMEENNNDHSYDTIIDTTTKHLNTLYNLINSDKSPITSGFSIHPTSKYYIQQMDNIPYPHLRPSINNPTSDLPQNNLNTTPNFDIPNSENNQNPSSNITQPPLTNINPDNIKNTPENRSNNSSSNKNRRRNSPLQSNILSTIAKTIFNKRISKKNIITDDKYRNRFHNTFIQTSSCNPHRKIVTNQLDILRLLLLYISLRPRCRQIDCLTTIANEQYEILVTMI